VGTELAGLRARLCAIAIAIAIEAHEGTKRFGGASPLTQLAARDGALGSI